MSHPFNGYRQTAVERSRVGHITRGYAKGGAVHDDAAEDKALIRKELAKHDKRADGGAVKHRLDRPGRARGGRAPKKKGTTNVHVNVIGGGHPAAGAMPPLPPGLPAGPPPRPPVMMPPGGAPPPAGPMAGGQPMPPMPPRMHGGPTGYKRGGTVNLKLGTPRQHSPAKAMEAKNLGRGKPVTYKRGGGVGIISTGKAGSTGKPSLPESALQDKTTIRRATGGPISSEKGRMAPHLPGGAGGGEARLVKQKRARSRGFGADPQSPTS